MIKYFNHFKTLFNEKKPPKVLIAVSGGNDSILLLYLFLRFFGDHKENIKIVHINHNIRSDSYKDEEFVKRIGKDLEVETHSRHLDPGSKTKIDSVESWARNGRYKILKDLLIEYKFDLIVTGHHKNDQAETILKNISEKTGLFGLSGIKSINQKIIRPLLPFSKHELMHIIQKYNIPYVRDYSNDELNFKRNFIRKKVLNPWAKEYTEVIDAIYETGLNFSKYQESLIYFIEDFIKKNIVRDKNNYILIDKNKLCNIPDLARIMVIQVLTNSLGQLRKFDFDDINNFLNNDKIGSIYKSRFGYDLLNDRKFFVIKKSIILKKYDNVEISIGEKLQFLNYEYLFRQSKLKKELSSDPNIEIIDQSKIKGKKLFLRLWESGDCFRPLGMIGKQKVSDFLINNKINQFEKLYQTVLLAGDNIIWLCGQRIDESVKISSSTNFFLNISRFEKTSI
ncbi:MAG: tRNA lysidine(34) synthetase TilS [Candidatus Neomarinimicrobiota bacterium]